MDKLSASVKTAGGVVPKVMTKETALMVGVGATAVVAAPLVLSAAGFGAAGVAAGSVAAWIQGPSVAAGSWFALSQSAGVLGLAAFTKAGIFAAGAGTTKLISKVVSKN